MSFRNQSSEDKIYGLDHYKNTCVVEREGVCGLIAFEFREQTTLAIKRFKILKSEAYVWSEFKAYLAYWLPFVKRVKFECKKTEFVEMAFNTDLLLSAKSLHKVKLINILPEQLTVDEAKVLSADTWITSPEDIVVCCIPFQGQWLCLDGYSRLMVALQRGYEYVYLFDEETEDSRFFHTCRRWCISEGILTLADLKHRIVSTDEHKKVWVDRCQEYLNLKEKPAICFDLQGTLGGEGLGDIREFEFYANTIPALRTINYDEYLLYIITNQSHIGKGYFSWEEYLAYETKLTDILHSERIPIEGFYCCSHTHKDQCLCKKPKPGLIHQMLDKRPLDLSKSFIIGDMGFDMLLAKSVGTKRILVKTGNGVGSLTTFRDTWDDENPDYIAEDIYDAVKWINQR